MDHNEYLKLCERFKAFVEAENSAGKLPTFRSLARRYKISQSLVLQIVEDCEMNYNVGIRVGNGIGLYDNQGSYTVEYLGR